MKPETCREAGKAGSCPSAISRQDSWLPVSLPRRTVRGLVLTIPINPAVRHPEPGARKTLRNPEIYAMELSDRMAAEGINRSRDEKSLVFSSDETTGAEAVFCCAGCGLLDLLELPERMPGGAQALCGDWSRRLVTERMPRTLWKGGGSEGGQQILEPALQIRKA